MVTYSQVSNIADVIFDSLNISDDLYMTMDKAAAQNFKADYIDTPDYLWDNIAAELANYDVSDMSAEEVEDIRMDIFDEVTGKLDAVLDNYDRYQSTITRKAIADIIDSIRDMSGVVDVTAELTGPEYTYNIRDIDLNVKFYNGAEITMNISTEENYI